MDEQKEPTIEELNAQIAAIQAKRDAMIAAQKNSIVAQIQALIKLGNIEAVDLGMVEAKPAATKAVSKEKVVKYRKGDDTWGGGRGAKPKWVKAVIEAGEDIEKYRVA